MCGIVCTNKKVPIDLIIDSIKHRGTCAPRWILRDGFTFCHTLMPVQGDKPTPQPYGATPYTLLYQGELWKHPGYTSDTAYLYDKLCHGSVIEVIAKLNGMFALVFYDGERIYFCSDIFGEQPLYYHHTGDGGFFSWLTVASELKQLVAVGIPYQQIKSCLPGVLYCYDVAAGTLEETTYHAFDYNKPRTKYYHTDDIRGLIRQSTALKLGAMHLQRPALLLSGGVDSAIMAYELSRLGLTEAFTVSSGPDSVDFTNAETTAARYGLHLTKVVCKSFDIETSIAMAETRNRSMAEEYVCHLALAKCLADHGYRVVFSGAGADELFVGYSYYLRFLNKERHHEVQQRFIQNYHKMDLRIINKVYMAHAVEVRNPFLDRDLTNYCLTLDVRECLIGGGIMKKALRDSYADRISSAGNKKLVAGETMGVKAYYECLYGAKKPRLYYPLFDKAFTDNGHLGHLIQQAKEVKYTIV